MSLLVEEEQGEQLTQVVHRFECLYSERDGHIVVDDIIYGGNAEKSGGVQRGDILRGVSARVIEGASPRSELLCLYLFWFLVFQIYVHTSGFPHVPATFSPLDSISSYCIGFHTSYF
jgi:hypothetical protein